MAPPLTDAQLANCPEPLKSFVIKHNRSYTAAAKALGVSKDSLGTYGRGKFAVPEALTAKITRALAAGQKPMPAIAIGAASRNVRMKKARAKLGKLDPLLDALLDKFDSNQSAAAKALGYANSGALQSLLRGRSALTPSMSERIHAVLDGKTPPPLQQQMARTARREPIEPDTLELGLAVVFCPADDAEFLSDVGEQMGGRWIFRLKAGDNSHWIMIAKFDDERLMLFGRIARRVAVKVTLP